MQYLIWYGLPFAFIVIFAGIRIRQYLKTEMPEINYLYDYQESAAIENPYPLGRTEHNQPIKD